MLSLLLRVRLRVFELDDRLSLQLDYRGREALPGDVQNSTLRLLYTGLVKVEVLEDRAALGAGRFLAPSVVLLPVDGGLLEVQGPANLALTLFGGRRGITTSRRNVAFDTVLPAVGGALSWAGPLTTQDDGALLLEDLEEPNHLDNRLRLGVAPGELGWVKLDARYRVRPGGYEVRPGLRLEANQLGLAGLYARAYGAIDNLEYEDNPDDDVPVDRLIWSAAAGWKAGDFDAQVGASFIERRVGTHSGRRLDGESGEDLSPFVLEAEQNGFLRLFYGGRRWFAGADIERSLNDAELRFMIQAGVLDRRAW